MRERKAVHGLAFQILVGVEVLAGGVDVGVAEEFLHRDDVAPSCLCKKGSKRACKETSH